MPKLTEWLMRSRPDPEPRPAPAPRPKPLRHAWYKVDGLAVHLDGQSLPHPCVGCRGLSELACDYPLSDGSTCDAPLCRDCAKEIGPDRHLCPLHRKIVERKQGPLL